MSPDSMSPVKTNTVKRRDFLTATAGALGLSGVIESLRPVSADEVQLDSGIARFSGDIEPLVRFLEETPRDEIVEQTAHRVQAGLSYRELLAALLLAGVRNIEPRPSVGFKFHAVLVVNSAHLASVSGPAQDRWLPIFWAIDYFKSSQARDVREGNWTLPPVDESNVPSPNLAAQRLREAMDKWDESAADVAVVSLVRHFGAGKVFNELSAYAARDYRSIGHKVIYLSNAQRTLQTIGWEYAEPVMRSVVYAMLNHHGEPNPSQSDLEADRPGRLNQKLREQFTDQWRGRRVDDGATLDFVQTLHDCSPQEASQTVIAMVNSGIALQSVWDGLYAASGELLMRRPGIVALHSVTTTNAIRHAFDRCGDDATRQHLLLQNASFLPMFREEARGRGSLDDRHIDQLAGDDAERAESIPAIFEMMGTDRSAAAEQMFGYLSNGGDPQSVVDHARRLVFLKGNDPHDYKFSSAALEDYRVLTPPWRNRFLAACSFQLATPNEPTRPLVQRIRDAIS
jgi:hypothetical protein